MLIPLAAGEIASPLPAPRPHDDIMANAFADV